MKNHTHICSSKYFDFKLHKHMKHQLYFYMRNSLAYHIQYYNHHEKIKVKRDEYLNECENIFLND